MNRWKRSSMVGLILIASVLSACSSNQNNQNQGAEPEITEQAETTAPPSATQESSETESKENTTDTENLDRIIEEQSFDTTLEGWGDVRFVSLRPEDSAKQDVQFQLLKDGKEVYTFRGMTEDNSLNSETFVGITAVAFKDYNEDGKKDVILILKYAQESGEEYNQVRIYSQSGDGNEFSIDEGLAEYLMAQYENDSIDSVMKGAKEFREYNVSLNEGSIPAQLDLIASQKEAWSKEYDTDFDYEPKFYTVTDLDGNGRLEVIMAICTGTGIYTYSSYYEVNEAFDGLTEIEQPTQEGDSQADIITDEVTAYYDTAGGRSYYIFDDLLKSSAAEYYESLRALSLQDGKLIEEYLANKTTIYQDADHFTITCTDPKGNTISEEEYGQVADQKYGTLDKIKVNFLWNQIDEKKDFDHLSKEELVNKLEQSYTTFRTRS